MKRILLLFLLVLPAVVSCNNDSSKQRTFHKSAVKVKVLDVKSEANLSQRSYVAKAEASNVVTLMSPFPAKLLSLNVVQGESVREGQVVAVVKSESVDNALSAAEATFRQAQDAYDRITSVKDNGSVAQLKIVEVETALEKARAAYNVAVKSASDCSVRAPFSGTISEVYVAVGENLVLSQPLLKMVDMESMQILISVPESEIASMTPGKRAILTVPALSDRQYQAKLLRRGVVASAVTHNYECALVTDVPVKSLMPGMVGKVVFVENAAGTAQSRKIVIPSSAVRTDENGRYVWTVTSENIVRKTQVSVGGFSGKGVIVTEGLNEGDRLIIEGTAKVSGGMKVEIVD